ncbi:hypothetical protein J1N09_00285 [Aureitalea sp. L0-47]|uniref:hypothetical protein n=1 Tax=Aureitalea sp. L0-47 TaxID=2816962 RepID=UPI00223771FF|nr:hypothetical protein [Aureitalea sp. L0-47]MCW5518254.1 hypothetical protein [Aureitalea sp. L0-47]
MSEKTLDRLIATLKSEAIEAADNKTREILENARVQSQKIIEEAEAKRDEMLQSAELEAEATREKGKAALQQAARDLSISVRNDLLKLLKSVLEREVKDGVTSETIVNAILKIVENVGGEATVELPENMQKELADKIQQRLSTSENLVSIITEKNLIEGFKISNKDRGWSYEITPEEVTELLFANLSPKWIELIKNESKR